MNPKRTPGPDLRLTVADTDTGTDASTAAQAFEPFFMTNPLSEGTGLGRSTVYGIVKQAGGDVWLDTAPGTGTMVSVYLPIATPRSAS